MLKSNGAEGRGVSAKVADFGLSVKMDHMETHMSNTFQGTMVSAGGGSRVHLRVRVLTCCYREGVEGAVRLCFLHCGQLSPPSPSLANQWDPSRTLQPTH